MDLLAVFFTTSSFLRRYLAILGLGLTLVLSGCASPAIVVQPLEWQTTDGPARGFVATVALDDPRIEVLVTGPLDEESPSRGGSSPSAEAVLEPTDAWARRAGADLAVNANFFGWIESNGTGPGSEAMADIIGLSASDGVVVSPARRYRDAWDDVLLIDRDGRARITAAFDATSVYDAVAGVGASDSAPDLGGRLVRAGRNTGSTTRVAPQARHPRTAVGINRAGTRLILVVIDGRQPGWSIGVTLPELADVMIRAGAWDAINLDGGGSSSFFYIAGGHPNPHGLPVTNRPSDGSFRPVATHLGIRLRDEPPAMR